MTVTYSQRPKGAQRTVYRCTSVWKRAGHNNLDASGGTVDGGAWADRLS